MSLDRLDSSKGYSKDNIILCHWWANHIKNKYPHKDFVDKCRRVYLNSLDR
jgi:hypothetical protein